MSLLRPHPARGLLLGLVLLLSACTGRSVETALPTVPQVDLTRYLGTWHEWARLPMWFQRECVASTARYSPAGDDRVAVLNSCRTANGDEKRAQGTARVVDATSNAKLEVEFDNWFSRLFPGVATGKYWVIYLDPEYDLAVVGHPNRKYLWILARTEEIDEARYGTVLEYVRGLGFDTERLVRRGQAG